jgi:hypothetical protein
VSFRQTVHAQFNEESAPALYEKVTVLSNLSADIRCAEVMLGCPLFRYNHSGACGVGLPCGPYTTAKYG